MCQMRTENPCSHIGPDHAHESETGAGRTTRRVLALAGVETDAAPRPVIASAGGDRQQPSPGTRSWSPQGSRQPPPASPHRPQTTPALAPLPIIKIPPIPKITVQALDKPEPIL